MTAQTLPNGRTTTNAVLSRESDHWESDAACRETDGDAFFSESKPGIARARGVCRRCPVLVECLENQQAMDGNSYQWGVGGGLSAAQRRALVMEAALGNHPNLVLARLLVSPRWSRRVRDLGSSRGSLAGIVDGLREKGLMVDVVTVRVAVWWLGGDGSRMVRGTHWRRQLRDHLDTVITLREKGARFTDIALYLGLPPKESGARALSELMLSVTAELEMAA
ncbi:WhiB family transcriptional regulator [Streptomyces sp. NBC_01422]|uniref:WhiB family transcriptional regulator n=1 Tax=Streptomyces sp. NBC_01422 TaxID=2903859 RepID=UPI002E29D8DF|nr:WhiB family transcriptional regulator [Streptomyces sp. NBC_01422]